MRTESNDEESLKVLSLILRNQIRMKEVFLTSTKYVSFTLLRFSLRIVTKRDDK